MNRHIIYKEIESIAKNHNIRFDEQYLRCGRGLDCGELCVDYSVLEGYILFSYDRASRTYYYSSKDKEEFLYIVFERLCIHNGFEYELKNRKSLNIFSYELNDDTRKVAFEYSLKQLREISVGWMERTFSEYERLLNIRRTNKNVYFDKQEMIFKSK
ncbi:hypothetical protein KCTCHS21_28690 [Cohnella abietis]|uniref:Immunity protein 63 domain-containing protein n=2 Tax=Cohnella abietis TaxID=2507935 RepID=A0A3T1D5U3_9BACL|nr:hypothetical protein KCTCHS21_28690 [Cohnella abietis]